jgi:Fur family transcriptional regulator, stress-responsive regulator
MAAADARRLRAAGPAPARLAALDAARAGRHHIVCRRCGAVASVDRVAGDAPCLEAAASAGFSVEEADVTFWGLCAACRAVPGPASPS